MPVNLEIKGSLAKCLATENLTIEHKKVSTACFDVDQRVLILPLWDKASSVVYDLLVGHEVGHALFTDNIDWTIEYSDVPKDFINVIEDVRVERLMKKKYPGLSKTFYNGYNELNDDDFFSTKDENLDKLSFIDRINLYFKIGAFHNIAFSDEENEFLTRISKLETFTEVLDISREIVNFVKYKNKEVYQTPQTSQSQGQSGEVDYPQNSQQNGDGEAEEDSMNLEQDSQESSSTDGESQGENPITMEQQSPIGGGGQPSREQSGNEVEELESKTSQSFDKKSQDLTDKSSQETAYVEIPKVYLENVIIPNKYIHEEATSYYNSLQYMLSEVDSQFHVYKASANKEVNYLVKEFECKKSADQYARSSVSRTGVLDTQKLHTYKYNEDLFKKVSVIPDGKNHGLIFILDWSGSMQEFILDAYKQLMNLVWFCKKVGIPFEVYAFTLECRSYVDIQPNHPPIIEKRDGVIALENSFRLMNILTSKVNAADMEKQMKNIWRCCWSFQKKTISAPRHLDLSGSPLAESMIVLHELIPQFQKKNKLQKVNVVFLTDGEGYVNKVVKRKSLGINDQDYFGLTSYYKCTLRNRKTGRVYSPYSYGNFPEYAKVLLSSLKDRFPTVNFVNFRIVPTREFHNCYAWYGDKSESYEKIKSQYKKNNFITFSGTGFDQFNVLPANSLSREESFNVEDGASNAKIKNAFIKMLSKKRTNKKLLSSFVDLIS